MRRIPTLIILSVCFPLLLAGAVGAEDSVPGLLGRSIARSDSLGFDEYRTLPPERQLKLRDDARKWLREVDLTRPDFQSFDACATAIGLCPYLAKAWMLYAQLHHDVGRYALSDYCLQQVRRTLRYEARRDERAEIEVQLHALEARAAYNLGDLERSLLAIEQALLLEPSQPELLLLQARSLGQTDRLAEAREILRRFEHKDPLYARALGILGNVELEAAEYEAAEDAFARAAKYGERGPIFQNDRGRLALARERFDEAASYFREAIELLPSFMEARSNLAVVQRRRGELGLAAQTLREILERQPDYAPAHFNLAELLRQTWSDSEGDERAALEREILRHYGLALRHGYEPGVAVQRRAEFALQLDDLQVAEEDLLEITRDPDLDPSVLFLLARVKKEQGELRVAGQLLAMAFDAGYDGAEAHGEAGEIHLRSGRIGEAIEAFERALARRPGLIVTRVNLSIALAMRGDMAAADAALREAEVLAPEHPAVQAQRRALRDAGDEGP